MEYTLPYFDKLDLAHLKEYYSASLQLKGNQVELDLNFEDNKSNRAALDAIKKIIESVEQLDERNLLYLHQNYFDSSADYDNVAFYVEHHLEELAPEEISRLMSSSDTSIAPALQLVKKLHLVRIGFYPENSEEFAVFDYTIGREYTNYLVVVSLKRNRKVESITIES